MFSFVYRELIMSDAQTTIILSAFAVVLILYVIKQERKSGVFALGQKKPRAILGSQKNKNRPRTEPKGCENVSIDSPDFQRCAQNLGIGRTVIPVDPTKRPARFDDFTKEDFLGNPLARDLKDGFAKENFLGGISIKDSGLEKSFLGGISIKDSGLEKSFLGGAKIKDTVLEEKFLGASTLADAQSGISRDGVKALRFKAKTDENKVDGLLGMEGREKQAQDQRTSDKSITFKIGDRYTTPGGNLSLLEKRPKREIGDLEAPPTGAFRSSLANVGSGNLGLLGMTEEALRAATNRLDDTRIVQRTTGGQLNLLR